MTDYVFKLLMVILTIAILLWLMLRDDKPFFKHKCELCGKNDKNWETIPTGHDDFGWQHKCDDVDYNG